ENDESHRDDRIDDREGRDGEADPRFRRGAAVDVAAIEHATREPPPPRLGGACGNGFGGEKLAHWRASGSGTPPVTTSGSTMCSINAPIGSAVPGGTMSIGFSGRRSRGSNWVASIGFRVR